MTLRQLRYFLGAAELGSFTAVADRMEVTQPAVAEQIRQLERYLQVDLFIRLGRGVRLTQAGQEFAIRARQVVTAAEEAERSVAEMRGLLGGTITFGAFGAPAHYGFAELIRVFVAAHPAVRLRILGRNSSETANAVRAGDLEAGLVVLPIDDEGLDVRPIAHDEVLFVSSDASQTRSPKTLEDLARSPLVLYEAHYSQYDPTRRQLAAWAQSGGIRLEAHFEVEHLDTALRLASLGLAGTYVPRAVTRSAGFPANLMTCSFEPRMFDAFAIITRRGTPVSAAMQEFLRMVTAHMGTVATPVRSQSPSPGG